MSISLPPNLGLSDQVSVSLDRTPDPRNKFASLIIKAIPALSVVAVCLAGALAFSLTLGEAALFHTREGGAIEVLTVILYGVALGCGLFLALRGHKAAGLIALLALLMGLRELDAHKAFTTYGVFKTRLYVSPDVPLAEKLIAAAVVIALLVLVVMAIRSSWRVLSDKRTAAGVTLLGLGGFGLFLKEVDGLPRKLADVGLALDPQLLAVSKSIEETGELGLPVLLGLALTQLVISHSNELEKKYTRY